MYELIVCLCILCDIKYLPCSH